MIEHTHLWLRAHAQYPGYDHEQPFAQDYHDHEQGPQAAGYHVSI
jgi:hypothetical protein